MKAISTYLLAMKKILGTLEAGKKLPAKSYAELFASATRKGPKSPRTDDSFLETIPSIYLEFALHVEKTILPYNCRKTF